MVDSHCHLAGTEFAQDLDEVIARAKSRGLAHALVILAADDAGEQDRAAAVSAHWPEVRFATGVHPHAAGRFAADPTEAARRAEQALDRQPLARGVGEVGLDYHYDFAPRGAQQQVFAAQIDVATSRRLPLVIHTREADDDTLRLLRDAGSDSGVFHCFTGDRGMARRVLDLGFHLSLAGIVTFPRALELKEVARMVPLDRLLVETDSPYLAPVPLRGTRNEPANVARIIDVVAELRGIDAQEVRAVTTGNFQRLFNP